MEKGEVIDVKVSDQNEPHCSYLMARLYRLIKDSNETNSLLRLQDKTRQR